MLLGRMGGLLNMLSPGTNYDAQCTCSLVHYLHRDMDGEAYTTALNNPRHQYIILPYRCLHLLAWIFIVNSLEANYLDFAWRLLLLAMNQPYIPPGKENSFSLLSFSPGR